MPNIKAGALRSMLDEYGKEATLVGRRVQMVEPREPIPLRLATYKRIMQALHDQDEFNL